MAAPAGFSTPIVTASSIYAFGREGNNETLNAYNRASGRLLWTKSYPVPFRQNKYATEMGNGPHSTPLFYQDRVYTFGIMGVLSCFQAKTGDLLWRKDFSRSIDTSNKFTGTAASPLIEGGLLLIPIGDDRKGSVTAFDPASGAVKWSWEGEGPGYSSPVAATIEGVRQVITLTVNRAISVDARDGKLLWSVPFKDEWNENIVTPVVNGNQVIFAGVRKGTFAFQVTRQAAQWTARELWHNTEYTMYMSSPILLDGVLYGMTNKRKGQIVAMDAKSGKVLWSTPGREGANVSIVSAAGWLFLLSETGDLKIARANAQRLDVAVEYKVSESATWPQPVLLGRNLLIRDARSLVMYRM